MRITLAAVAIAALTSTAFAGESITMGAGTVQCSEITQMYRTAATQADIHQTDLIVGSWASGFMSAINYSRKIQGSDSKNLPSMTFENQVITIRRYCKHHPDHRVWSAVGELFESLPSNDDANVSEVRRDFR